MRFRVKDIVPFAVILLAAFAILWVYFYFMNHGSRVLAYPIEREFKPCKFRIGDHILKEYFTTSHPSIYSIHNVFYINRGEAKGQTHWTEIDSLGRTSDYGLNYREGLALRWRNREQFFFFADNSYIEMWLNRDIVRSYNLADSLVDIICLSNTEKLLLAQLGTGTAAHLQFAYRKNEDPNLYTVLDLPSDGYNSYLERLMAYDGAFFSYGGYVTYTSYHTPWVWVFSSDGKYIQTITTRDSVPMPSLIHYENAVLYKRGETFNTNAASFIQEGLVYVFSQRVDQFNDEFVLDAYELKTGRYTASYHIPAQGAGSNLTIYSLHVYNNTLYVESEDGVFALLKD